MSEEVEFLLPHEWARDEDGSIKYVDQGDYCGGPYCLRCEESFCQHCKPGIWDEPCFDQEPDLFAPPFTETQRAVRLRYLNDKGFILRRGVIVGWREPNPVCKPLEHKWRVKSRTETGEGWRKRVYKTYICVVCHRVESGNGS